jgi:hypothetical protein
MARRRTTGSNVSVSLTNGVVIDTQEIVAALSAQANTKLGRWARDSFAESRKSSNFRAKIEETNKELAADTAKQIIRAYKSGKKRGREPYRQNDLRKIKRYSDGQMDKALQKSNFIKGDSTGITMDFSILGKYAKQWARLNFGAGTAGSRSKSVGDEKIKMFRRTLQDSPTLSKFGPRPGFLTPSSQISKKSGGFRSFGVSSDKPYAKTPSPASIVRTNPGKYIYVYQFKQKGLGNRGFLPKKSKGIRGWRFIDTGIAYMNDQYGRRMTKVFNDWVTDLEKNARKSAQKQSRRRS